MTSDALANLVKIRKLKAEASSLREFDGLVRSALERAIGLHGIPEKITIDKSGANTAAVNSIVADNGINVELRQSKYLNNLVEQNHRAIKRRTRPMLGFKQFHCAAKLIAGIETMHMIKRGQLDCPKG